VDSVEDKNDEHLMYLTFVNLKMWKRQIKFYGIAILMAREMTLFLPRKLNFKEKILLFERKLLFCSRKYL